MERVFAVRREAFFAGRWPQGFTSWPATEAASRITELEDAGFFAPRPAAEGNPAWKQLIPYCIVTAGRRMLCVRRLAAQGERRLHGRYSIGIGGHVNPQDAPPRGAVLRALRRELLEELAGPGLDRFRPLSLGLLNDDGTGVGRVHAGLVFRLDLGDVPKPEAEIRVREIAKMEGRFRPIDQLGQPSTAAADSPHDAPLVGSAELWQDRRAFESWSAIMLDTSLWACQRPFGEGSERGDREDSHDG